MIFNSLHFLIFFPIVFSIYQIIPHRFRWFWLLISSCYFYMAFLPAYILILIFLIIVDYFAALLIEKRNGKSRQVFLILSCIANLAVLGLFKYFNFINENITHVLFQLGIHNPTAHFSLPLPIGLSFHVFQSLSYTIEVYRREQPAEHHFGIYALYVLFFPQLVAGPIERATRLLHQFREKYEFNYSETVDGLKIMAWGFFLKIVIADRLCLFVNEAYRSPSNYSGTALLIATVFFAFQIYCDFYAYSTIAIGVAKTMGFELMKNFDSPYFSTSFAEFWRRWHISLSSWFRDYVYIPMGGSHVPQMRRVINVMFVFLLSGLWHGANWTYVVWGGIHGFLVCLESFFQKSFMATPIVKYIRTSFVGVFLGGILTFSLVVLSWVFFRASNMEQASYVFMKVLGALPNLSFTEILKAVESFSSSHLEFYLGVFLILFLLAVEYSQKRISWGIVIGNFAWPLRWGVYFGSVLLIIILGRYDTVQFIYFQF